MKILVLNGSPHKDGNTAFLVNAFKEGAESAGHEVNVVNVCEKKIAGCIGCDACADTGRCVFDDDMQAVYDLIDVCEMVVFASPVYYHFYTGQLQSAISRIYCYGLEKVGAEKQAALILTSGDDGVYGPGTDAYKLNFIKYLGWEDKGVYTTHDGQHKTPEKYEELKAFGASL